MKEEKTSVIQTNAVDIVSWPQAGSVSLLLQRDPPSDDTFRRWIIKIAQQILCTLHQRVS